VGTDGFTQTKTLVHWALRTRAGVPTLGRGVRRSQLLTRELFEKTTKSDSAAGIRLGRD